MTVQLTHREQVGPVHYLLSFDGPAVAGAAHPGQFVHLRLTEGLDPLLRRPFSIMDADSDSGSFQLLVRTVGRGSQILAQAQPGNHFNALGPLGTPFALPGPAGEVVLVAGGVGVAPLIFLAGALHEPDAYRYVRGLFGAATENELCCWLEFSGRCDEFTAVTQDGSSGEMGLVTDFLPEQLERGGIGCVYACGPVPMLAEVAHQCASQDVPCVVSLEQWMGCGVGACLGCVIPMQAAGTERYQRVCQDGPVFVASHIDWEAMALGCGPG